MGMSSRMAKVYDWARDLAHRRRTFFITVASAILVSLVLQAVTIARNNYNLWRLSFMAIELGVALVSSFAANYVRGIEERAKAWAQSYVPGETSWLYKLLSVLPVATVRAAIMCACLSIPNATVIPMVIYRETVVLPPVAVIVRFLADYPQCVIICAAVMLVVDWLASQD